MSHRLMSPNRCFFNSTFTTLTHQILICLLFSCFSFYLNHWNSRKIDSDDDELEPPLNDLEIKNGQWMGVTVRSQKNSGKVKNIIFLFIETAEKFLKIWWFHQIFAWWYHLGAGMCSSVYRENGRITTWSRAMLCAY